MQEGGDTVVIVLGNQMGNEIPNICTCYAFLYIWVLDCMQSFIHVKFLAFVLSLVEMD